MSHSPDPSDPSNRPSGRSALALVTAGAIIPRRLKSPQSVSEVERHRGGVRQQDPGPSGGIPPGSPWRFRYPGARILPKKRRLAQPGRRPPGSWMRWPLGSPYSSRIEVMLTARHAFRPARRRSFTTIFDRHLFFAISYLRRIRPEPVRSAGVT